MNKIKVMLSPIVGQERDGWVCPPLSALLCNLAAGNDVPPNIDLTIKQVCNRPVEVARNFAAQQAITAGMDWIMQIDNDQALPPNILNLVVEAEANPAVNVVGCPTYMTSSFPLFNFVIEESGTQITKGALRNLGNGFRKVRWIGAGCLLIRTSILSKLPKPWFRWVTNDSGQDTVTGEDQSFCEKVNRYGFDVHVHPAYLCDHLKTGSLDTIATARDAFANLPSTQKEFKEWRKNLPLM